MPRSARPQGPISTVRAFLAALENLDIDGALAYAAPDMLYQNVPLPPARGRDAVERQLRLMARYGTGFRADIHNIASNGDTVLTERTDGLRAGRWQEEFWVCGTFELRDGQIVLWRDYFDWATVIGKGLVGTARAVTDTVKARTGRRKVSSTG